MTSHDVVQNVFAAIAKKNEISCLQKQTHVLLLPTLQYSCCRVEIVLLVDGVHTLVDVVIVDPTQIDLVLQVVFSRGVVTTIMV
jgi:hypothetical protein